MKTRILLLLFFITTYSFSQSVNDYKAVIIPMKYDFQKSENQYRLQTMTKFNLNKAGMNSFYTIESIPAEFNDRCSLLYIDAVEDKGFLVTKLYLTFKDCNGKIIYKSEIGKSKEKEFGAAYTDALNKAFESVLALEYNYNGGVENTSVLSNSFSQGGSLNVVPSNVVPAATAVVITPAAIENNNKITSENKISNVLYAQPTSYGYQLVDSEPKVIMKVYKTSNPASFMATKGDVQGILVSKENKWFFEYYKNDQLISEIVDVKF